jgi:hypothetical protein
MYRRHRLQLPAGQNKKHMTGFEIAQLQNEKYLGLVEFSCSSAAPSVGDRAKCSTRSSLRETWTPIERVYLITAEDL